MPQPTRKLAAIMFTDIAGFTALSSHDEEKALELIDEQRRVLKPIVAEFNGEWLKEMGDGLLLSFPSSKQAVNCAIKIQHTVKAIPDLNLRIGIHQGDILAKGGDVFGDDVNISSRMEPFAAVGGVAISHKVAGDISGSPEFKLKLIGQPQLKGVKQQVRIYCITSHGLPETDISAVSAKLEEIGPTTPLQQVIAAGRKMGVHKFRNRIIWVGTAALVLTTLLFVLISPRKERIPFENRDWILITDFGNTTGDTVLSGALEEMVARELSQSRYVNVVPPERKFDALRLMKKSPETQINEALAREVALRDGGIRAILSGSIRKIGDMFTITVHLIDPQSDTRVISLSEDSHGLKDILAAIRRLSERVRKHLGESLSEIAPPKSGGTGEWYEKVTTANLKALQLYRRGYVYVNQFNWEKALLFTQQAIEQDSTFAMAYVMLGFMYSNTGRGSQGRPYLDKALSLSEDLTDREKYFIRGGHAFIFGDYEEAIDQYSILVGLYPDDFWGQTNLYVSYAWMQETQKAFEHLKEAVQIRPNDPGSLSMLLLWELAALEDMTAAEKTYQRITRLAPDFDFPSYQIFKALQLWITGDVEGAENEFQRVSERAQGYGPWTQDGINMTLVNFEVFKGQFKPGLEWIEKNFAFTQKINSMEGQAALMVQKGLLFKELGSKQAFENEFHKLLEQFPEPLSSMGAAWLAYDKVQAGQISESKAYLEQFKNSALNPLEKQAFVHLIEGRIAQATNQMEDAIKHFQQAKQLVKVSAGHPPPYFYSTLLADLALAEVYEQNHQLDKAIEVRQEIIDHKIQSFYPGFVMDVFEWVKAHYHLGRLYELKGDREKATEYYQEFLGYWSGADQPLPEIQAAKDRLARLSEGK